MGKGFQNSCLGCSSLRVIRNVSTDLELPDLCKTRRMSVGFCCYRATHPMGGHRIRVQCSGSAPGTLRGCRTEDSS